MSGYRAPGRRGEQTERIIPKPLAYWLPNAGDVVQLKDPKFPDSYGKHATVVARVGFARVRVKLDERTFTIAVRLVHRVDLHGEMAIDGAGL